MFDVLVFVAWCWLLAMRLMGLLAMGLWEWRESDRVWRWMVRIMDLYQA